MLKSLNREFLKRLARRFVAEFPDFRLASDEERKQINANLQLRSEDVERPGGSLCFLVYLSDEEPGLFTCEISFVLDDRIADFRMDSPDVGGGRRRMSQYWGEADFWWHIKTSEKLRLHARKHSRVEWVCPDDVDDETATDRAIDDVVEKFRLHVRGKHRASAGIERSSLKYLLLSDDARMDIPLPERGTISGRDVDLSD